MLYPELFKQLEAVRWSMDDDIPWASFDASKLSDEQAQTVKMNAITEWAALPATEMFLRDNRDDSDFSAFMSVWFFEEQKHSLVLMEYLRRFRPDLVPTEQELHEVRFEFDPAPALETLMLHFCGEIRLNHWYRRAAEWHTEPVIKAIYETLARDEARHGGAYLRYMKRALQKSGDEAKAAFAKVGVLMASARRTAQALHPDQPARQRGAVPARHGAEPHARSGVARGVARQADPVRQRLGRQGGRAHPAQPEPAARTQVRHRAGPQPLPQGSHQGAGRRVHGCRRRARGGAAGLSLNGRRPVPGGTSRPSREAAFLDNRRMVPPGSAQAPTFSRHEFRAALGMFATGVTIVTARDASGLPIGLTANSFNSVSLEPPLVLWSLSHRAGSMPAFSAGSHYAVHILAAEQRELAERFAQRHADRFDGLVVTEGAGGAPILPDVAAVFECFNRSRYDEGDHTIFVGEVERCRHREGASPLIFHGGRFFTELPL